jgi:type I restriction enzyme S subunit
MAEWRKVRLGEVALEVTVGHVGPMVDEYQSSGVPFLRSQNVRPYRIDMDDIKYIDDEFHARLKKSMLHPGDVVTVRTGKPGQTAVVPDWMISANCSDLVITRPGPELNARWLSYYINWVIDSHIAGHLVGAVQQHFNVKSAKNLELTLPDVAEQEAIAEVLGALDDKIAANDQLIATSEELAKFTWHREAADGMAVSLSSLARFVNGKAFTKDASGAGRVVIRIAELNSGLGGSTVYNDIEVEDDHLARPGDLLFAWSGSLTVARWFRPEAIVNQHIFKVIPHGGHPLWLVNQALRTKLTHFQAIAADKATTMGHIQRRHLDEHVVVPTKNGIDRLDDLMAGLWDRALAAEQENVTIMEARDELLPLLMSGKVRVRNAENLVEEVV